VHIKDLIRSDPRVGEKFETTQKKEIERLSRTFSVHHPVPTRSAGKKSEATTPCTWKRGERKRFVEGGSNAKEEFEVSSFVLNAILIASSFAYCLSVDFPRRKNRACLKFIGRASVR